MTFLERAITDGHAKFTGEGKQQKILYAAANHTERCSGPEESAAGVAATPSSRERPGTPFGLAAGSGDTASPALSATGASQPRPPARRRSTAVPGCGCGRRLAASSNTGWEARPTRRRNACATRFTQDSAAPTALGRIELKRPIKFSTRFGNGRILPCQATLHKYIKTVADVEHPDNLLSLPGCPL